MCKGYLGWISLGDSLFPEPITYGSINPVSGELFLQHYLSVNNHQITAILTIPPRQFNWTKKMEQIWNWGTKRIRTSSGLNLFWGSHECKSSNQIQANKPTKTQKRVRFDFIPRIRKKKNTLQHGSRFAGQTETKKRWGMASWETPLEMPSLLFEESSNDRSERAREEW